MMSPYTEASTAVKRVCIQKRIHVHSSMITYMQMNKNPGVQTMRVHRQTHLESTGELQHLCRLKICNTLLEFFCTCEPVSCAPCACVCVINVNRKRRLCAFQVLHEVAVNLGQTGWPLPQSLCGSEVSIWH